MHGNYRHQYLLSSSSTNDPTSPPPPPPPPPSEDATKTLGEHQPHRHAVGQHRYQRPTDNNNSNGLPISHQYLQHYKQHCLEQKQQQQQQQAAFSERQCNRNACEMNFNQLKHQFKQFSPTHQHNHHHQMIHAKSSLEGNNLAARQQPGRQQQQQQQHCERDGRHDLVADHDDDHDDDDDEEGYRQNYARQLRSSQLQHRFQQQLPMQHNQASAAGKQQPLAAISGSGSATASGSSASCSPQAAEVPAAGTSGGPIEQKLKSQQQPRRSSLTVIDKSNPPADGCQANSNLHVNFNRSSQFGPDEDDSDGRKKKYLTAKYGQQQMNLIKKRLKVETWLYEQLKELAKGCDCEAELDEIDIDLDQLLDMEDDDTRRRWLGKTLEPFEELPRERLNKFVEDVLEQSRLL